ncbi:UBX domain-containing protein 1 [Agrilus planipennis]|uniref:UBX domain-containing protein 1 n=1 Tax=Agrilus planipennis TaxID=224129 RepID=A0A1W4X9R8_AGRPL|nr:UBX domain-containing protein 1 [Agrilus planipennis]
MPDIVETLVEMGFSRERAELAVSKTKAADVESAMEWLLSHEEEIKSNDTSDNQTSSSTAAVDTDNLQKTLPDADTVEAKSVKCDDCGKLFKTQEEIEFHAAKSGHENFSESTEEKKPLTEEEKKEQLAKIEEKLKQRRLEREAKEKQEELEREKSRIRSGKDLLEAKRKQEETEMKKLIEQRKREKQEEKLARERVKLQIEQDRLARKAKQTGENVSSAPPPPTPNTAKQPQTQQNYAEVKLQIRLTNGSTLTQTFGPKEPLSAVRLYVEMNRTDENGPFALMTSFPRKIFGAEDYEKPLDVLGLAPSAVLIVSKT